jgi:glycosyltransferase involved in cell wall biosynthesis
LKDFLLKNSAPVSHNPHILRIAYVLPVYWPAIGGCELHTHELVKRLSGTFGVKVITLINEQKDKLSYELWIACILKAPAKLFEYKDGRTKVVRPSLNRLEKCISFMFARIQSPKLPDFFTGYAMEIISKLYMRKLIKLIKGSDLIHCIHGGVSYLGYAALKTARQLDIPFVYTPVLHLHDENRSKNKNYTLGDPDNAPILKLILTPRGYTDKFWLKICHEADALVTMTDFESKFFIDNHIAPQKIFKIGIGPLISESSATGYRRGVTGYSSCVAAISGYTLRICRTQGRSF